MISQAVAERATESEPGLTFKIATEEWELEQVFELNYATFVEEVPQHDRNSSRRLVDRFHDENTYFICLKGNELAGMVALRDRRPFSLDEKLGSIDEYLPPGSSICEIRLLSVDKERRNGRVIQGLLSLLARHCIKGGYDIAVISGNVSQQKLYRGLGFVPFGPVVGTPEAAFQPMYRRLETLEQDFTGRFHPSLDRNGGRKVNLMPGPVAIGPDVSKAFAKTPVSHRSPEFMTDMTRTKSRLSDLTGARSVEILLGSGTMANDAIAAQLSLEEGRGLVLSNGEFGDRLLDHAARMGLDFDSLEQDWGRPFDTAVLASSLGGSTYSWLWAVHCETSTGVLNDIGLIRETCATAGARLVLDCISSIGTLPVDLSGVFLASGVSGKGLGSYPGLSMVFYNHELEPRPDRLPRYLDMGLHASKGGVPFTMSSNLVYALDAALDRFDAANVFEDIAETSTWLRQRLRDLGFRIVAADACAAPAVITLALPPNMSSTDLGDSLEQAGFSLSYNSEYLRARNWIQICLMGEFSRHDVEPLLGAMAHIHLA
jgi:aspartate aminotransferase-like enzyme